MSKSQLLQIRLEESKKAKLDRLCQQEQVTLSEKIRELIEAHIEAQYNPKDANSMTQSNQSTSKKSLVPSYENEKKRVFTVGEMYSGPGGIGLALTQTHLHLRGQISNIFEETWGSTVSSEQNRWEECTKVLSRRDIQQVMGTPWR